LLLCLSLALARPASAAESTNLVARIVRSLRLSLGKRKVVPLTQLQKLRFEGVERVGLFPDSYRAIMLQHVEPEAGSPLAKAVGTLRKAHELVVSNADSVRVGLMKPEDLNLRFAEAHAHTKGGVLTHYTLKMFAHNGQFPLNKVVTVLPDGEVADPLFSSSGQPGIFGVDRPLNTAR